MSVEGPDGGSALGLAPARLTITFGFGAGLFVKDGSDRYGLAAKRPAALVDLPKFNGDQLEPARTGGDISVQACADDPHGRVSRGPGACPRCRMARPRFRWAQAGFLPQAPPSETPRNLMGFKDGTNNPRARGTDLRPTARESFDDVVWVGDEGPDWMRGGSYRGRAAHPDFARALGSLGGRLSGASDRAAQIFRRADRQERANATRLDLDRVDADGNPLIADNAHVRLGAAATNGGAQIFRRPYSYNDGVRFTAERWPPWRQGMMYDAGLFFICYQRDPREGFIKIYENMAKLDALNQFTTHTGGGLFACPGGIREGEFVGQRLL